MLVKAMFSLVVRGLKIADQSELGEFEFSYSGESESTTEERLFFIEGLVRILSGYGEIGKFKTIEEMAKETSTPFYLHGEHLKGHRRKIPCPRCSGTGDGCQTVMGQGV